MEELLIYIQANVQYAHWIIFGSLLLAGLNIPVSEDAMLFISALLASKNPELKYQLFFGVFAGAYLSDVICYWLGRTLGPKIWNIKFFSKMISPEKVEKLSSFYKKFGVTTLLVGRFIPFGVRNGLFLTAGLSKMNFFKFALSDLIACTISCTLFFNLYFNYGEIVIEYVKKGNIILFSTLLTIATFWFIFKKKKTKAL
jgi:membrane-associated protein